MARQQYSIFRGLYWIANQTQQYDAFFKKDNFDSEITRSSLFSIGEALVEIRKSIEQMLGMIIASWKECTGNKKECKKDQKLWTVCKERLKPLGSFSLRKEMVECRYDKQYTM